MQHAHGVVRFSYNLYFSACFFSRNNVFLPQQISQNSVSACFFSEAHMMRVCHREILLHVHNLRTAEMNCQLDLDDI